MSSLTYEEILAQEEAALEKEKREAPRPTTAGEGVSPSRRGSRRSPDVVNMDDVEMDGVGGFLLGATDTIMFGFADEVAAFGDSFKHEWLGDEDSMSYEEALRMNRSILGKAEQEHGGAYLSGQIAGAFVPTAGVGVGKAAGRGISALRSGGRAQVGKMTADGFIQGALYGYGSSESEELFSSQRVGDAAMMGAFGAGGGFVLGTTIFQGARLAKYGWQRGVSFRTGKSPKVDLDYSPIGIRANAVVDDVAEDIDTLRSGRPSAQSGPRAAAAATETPPINRITGKVASEMEEGAVASADDLVNPAMRDRLLDKVTQLTPAEAKVAAKKLTDAMESGDLTKEPHFRSILGLDLSEFGDEDELIPEVSDILKDMAEGIIEKAGMGSQTARSWEKNLRARYGDDVSEAQLDGLIEKTKEAQGSATVGKLQMVLAGVKFARTSKDLMPRVLKGEKDAREALASELSTALRISAKGQILVSGAGRELGMLKHSTSLLYKRMGDGYEVETAKQIEDRVRAAFDQFDDEQLGELLARTRDLSDLEEVSNVLLDPARAEQVGLWMRAKNTFEAFIKSNTLTPATALFNLVGAPIHSWIRNGGAAIFAEAAARAAGDEAVATKLMMRRQVVAAVRWNAHAAGVKAALSRVKWEALGSWKSIAGAAGMRKSQLAAGVSRQAMIARGYKPPKIREFDLKKRLAVTDTRAFNERLAERAESGAPFASFVNAMERAGATALNTIDAAGTATAKIASGVVDDYGRAMVMTKEVYGEMAAAATEKALREGVEPDQLGKYVSRQAKEWSTIPPEDILARVEKRLASGDELDDVDQMLLRRDHDAEKEAERVLFLDGAQTKYGKAGATIARGADAVAGLGQFKGALMPYIQTPTRILERGLANYTPWGHLTKETQDILARGGSEAALERARMDIGGTIIGAGMIAAASGSITVTNGANYKNTANLGGAPSNRVNFPGGGYVEFGRLEPLAMGLAMGGALGQMWKAAQEAGDKYGQDDALAEGFAIAYGGFRDAILEKSYMTGLSELVEAFTSQEEGALMRYFQRFAPDAVSRTIPYSGTFRQLNETISGKALEASGALDRIAKVTPGLGMSLPARVDALGNEIEGRTFGLAVGSTGDLDELTQNMRELGVDITNLRKADPQGFDLTSEELSELRKIRATEARNKHGQTMREALSELLNDPEFQALPDKAMVQDEVVRVMRPFNEPAREIYEYRNQQYLADREAARSLKEYKKNGLSEYMAGIRAREEVESYGLEPSRVGQ